MRKLCYLTILALAVSFVLTSCSKKEEFDSSNNEKHTITSESGEPISVNRDTDTRWKWPNIPFQDESEPGCIQGLANCLEFCCVTPKTVSDFIDAIDTGNVQSYLSDSDILKELGQDFEYYEQLLREVRDGSKDVIHYTSIEYGRVMILYGDGELSFERFEAAQALRL
jgi:hypothetical protein